MDQIHEKASVIACLSVIALITAASGLDKYILEYFFFDAYYIERLVDFLGNWWTRPNILS